MTYPGARTLDVHRLTNGADDAHGNTTQTWALSHQLPGCLVAPPTSVSNANRYEPFGPGREQVNTLFEVYAPAGSDITAYDRVDLYGRPPLFEVIGEPGGWTDPWSGAALGVVFALQRRAG